MRVSMTASAAGEAYERWLAETLCAQLIKDSDAGQAA